MMLWLVVIVCLLVSFVFSGIEAGILSVNRVRLRHRAKLRDRAALRLQRLLRNPERLLLTVVIVTSMANIVAITLTTYAMVRRWGHVGYLLSLLLFLPLYLFGLELFPKSLFRRFPYRALALLSQPLRIADLLLAPGLRLTERFTRRLASSEEPDARKLFAAREDFKYLTIESERAGTLTTVERQLIHNVVDFRNITARDLMEPIAEVPTIRNDRTLEELIAASNGGSVERFLVIGESGEILGLVNVFEVLLDAGPRSRVSSYVRSLTSVPVNDPAPRLMRKLRVARTPVALVIDNGQPVGIVLSGGIYKRLFSPAGQA
ncbi:MAG: CNNM domain-containing protein [Verrucomicrobiota bacterium]